MQARVLAEEFLISLARRQILSLLSIITIDRASNLLVNLSLLVNKQEKCSNRMIYLVLMMYFDFNVVQTKYNAHFQRSD